GRPVGVDVERVRVLRDMPALVRSCFAAEEQAEFWSLPAAQRTRAFFTGWTRKEALLKATGEGLSRPRASVAGSLASDAPPRPLRWDGSCGAGANWTLVDLPRDDGTAAAVAAAGAGVFVRVRMLVPELLGLSHAETDVRAAKEWAAPLCT